MSANHVPATPQAPSDSAPYQRALQTGRLDDLRNTVVYRLIQQAASGAVAEGIVDELGTLRVVLARLVTEQDDLKTLASEVARVAAVAIRAAQVQHAIRGSAVDEVYKALRDVLDEVMAARAAT
jgi:hypothetical protein